MPSDKLESLTSLFLWKVQLSGKVLFLKHPFEDDKTFLGEQKRLNRVRQNDELLIFHKAPFYEMKGNARLLTRPRMSQVRAPFDEGTDAYRRWRNVVHINGELCDILRHICEKEDNDPSLRVEISVTFLIISMRRKTKTRPYGASSTISKKRSANSEISWTTMMDRGAVSS